MKQFQFTREFIKEENIPCWITGSYGPDASHIGKTVGAGADWTRVLPMARLVHIYYESRMNNEGLWLRRYPDWPFQRLYAAVDEFQGEYREWLRASRYRDLIG